MPLDTSGFEISGFGVELNLDIILKLGNKRSFSFAFPLFPFEGTEPGTQDGTEPRILKPFSDAWGKEQMGYVAQPIFFQCWQSREIETLLPNMINCVILDFFEKVEKLILFISQKCELQEVEPKK